ncbi:MAG: CRISPR-associated protein Cas2 [Treponemataceae bacterium]|nr:CRISPR-associated protein Cas2 [Treponemataceae bacterium]
MFVSVVLDPGVMDTAKVLSEILDRYGFEKIQRSCWENSEIDNKSLNELKKEIDDATDSYDTVRFYQFPIDDKFVITELNNKKWKRIVLSAEDFK